MDNTKKYIEMCEKAKEIQALRKDIEKIESGDWFYTNEHVAPIVDGGFCYGEKKWIIEWQQGWECEDNIEFLGKGCVWLPRQDQLQKIVGGFEWAKENLLQIFEGTYFRYYQKFKSMEQLWLGFAMKEKYNKTWNGKEWIK